MFNPFAIVPILVCVYEIISLILPLKLSLTWKILASLLLFSGLAKILLFHRTPTGLDIYELPYSLTLVVSLIFNFMIVALFLLLIKDLCWLIWKIFTARPFPGYNAALFVFSVASCATLYGTWQALTLPDVKTHEVHITNLGPDLEGFRIAMLVDIHADTLTNREFVAKLVDMTNAENPDVILIPGDFVDGQVETRRADLEPLKDLRARYGVYGTTGNHEYYFDLNGWLDEFVSLGIKILDNEHVIITSGDSSLVIAGVPDQTGANHDTARALKDSPENAPVILMDHRPSEARENASLGNIALQVSGHTHGGQMPIIYSIVKKANRGFVRGWYDVGDFDSDSMKLFVSPGTSQWNGFALRLFDPSEISLFILRGDS